MDREYPNPQKRRYTLEALALADSLAAGFGDLVNASLQKKLARCNNLFGVLQLTEGNPDGALNSFEKALRVREALNDQAGIANSYNNIGATFNAVGDYSMAAFYHFRSLGISEKLSDSAGLGFSCFNLGRLHLKTGEPDKAMSYASECVRIRKKTGDMRGLAEAYSTISEIHFTKNEKDKAMAFERMALHISDSIGWLPQSANSHNNIAVNYMSDGKYAPALEAFRRAVVLYDQLNFGFQKTRTLANIGKTLVLSTNYKEAKEILVPIIDSIIKYRQEEILPGVYNDLAMSDSALGNYKAAFRFARLREAQTEKNMEVAKHRALNELEKKYQLSKKEAENILLANQNQLQDKVIRRNTYFIAALSVIAALLVLAGILVVKQNRMKADERNRLLEQRLLRAQMNPHFIFNTLQAIQNYILKNDNREAIRYLHSFASLTRDVLENSRSELIPLTRETALLDNYLKLQKLRFGNRFDYRINVDKDLEFLSVKVPPMLSQPFIENALEHGLRDKPEGGLIEVSFGLAGRNMSLEITDNGSGMNSKNQGNMHSSRATEITRERLSLLGKRTAERIQFTISEAYADSSWKGVKVSFRLPLAVLT